MTELFNNMKETTSINYIIPKKFHLSTIMKLSNKQNLKELFQCVFNYDVAN